VLLLQVAYTRLPGAAGGGGGEGHHTHPPAPGLIINMLSLQAVDAFDPMAVCVPVCSGLLLPARGVRGNAASGVLLRLASPRGNVSWQKVQTVQPVGACQVSVSWGNARLGETSSAEFRLQCAMPLMQGERITISLGGFALEALAPAPNTEVKLAGVRQKVFTNSSSESYTSSAARRLLNHEQTLFKPAEILWRQGVSNASNALVLEATGLWSADETREFVVQAELGLRLPVQLKAGLFYFSHFILAILAACHFSYPRRRRRRRRSSSIITRTT
jgi:hypothetical protein